MKKMFFRYMFMFIFLIGFPVLSFALECTYREDVEPEDYYSSIENLGYMNVVMEENKEDLIKMYKKLEIPIKEYISENNSRTRFYFTDITFKNYYTYDCPKGKCDLLDINNSIIYCEEALNNKCKLIAAVYKEKMFCTATTGQTLGKFDPFKENK